IYDTDEHSGISPPSTFEELRTLAIEIRDEQLRIEERLAMSNSQMTILSGPVVDDLASRISDRLNGSHLYTITPCRVADTRPPNGAHGGPSLPSGTARLFTLPGRCSIPPAARSIVANIT